MKKQHKTILSFLLLTLLFSAFSVSVFAVTEEEVLQQIASSSKEVVSGNIFVWFLCAIAFLKISQKIDSFMSSLGISVGHTGGSMLAEAMMMTRGLASAKGGVGKLGFGGGGSGGRGQPGGSLGLSGGLAGVVGRQFQNDAIGSATGTGGNFLSNQAFNASLKKDGAFANDVIGAVAKGNMAQLGSITGDKASTALTSYMGLGKGGGKVAPGTSGSGSGPANTPNPSGAGLSGLGGLNSNGVPIPSAPNGIGSALSMEGTPLDAEQTLEHGGIPSFEASDAVDYTGESSAYESAIGSTPDVAEYPVAGSESAGMVESGVPASAGSTPITPDTVNAIPESPYSGNSSTLAGSGPVAPEMTADIPTFENVEIGGGRITGSEVTSEHPKGREFAMYNTDQYTAPQGQYDIVKAVDNSKWYKQYAVSAVEKTPKMGKTGKIEYNEKIVQVMPPTPKRKDRI